WPAIDNGKLAPPIGTSMRDGLRYIFDSNQERSIWPIVIETAQEVTGIEHLQRAYIALAKVSTVKTGRFISGALQICWRYLRAMENLCIPLDLFEAESQNYWSVNSLTRTRQALDKYIQALAESKSGLYESLIDVQNHLHEAHSWF